MDRLQHSDSDVLAVAAGAWPLFQTEARTQASGGKINPSAMVLMIIVSILAPMAGPVQAGGRISP
jgi:hypothetical protein